MESNMRMVPYIGLGLVAAILAAVLVGLMQSDPQRLSVEVDSSGEATILAAARDLPAGSRLSDTDLVEAQVAAAEVPQGASSSRSILIGRTILLPLAKGQAIGASALVPMGTGPEIASRLAEGWRAITVEFADASPQVVLYPGASVDVLATLELRSVQTQLDTYVTTTVLEGVQVLAVGDRVAGAQIAASTKPSKTLTLTLLVSVENAKLLELASERGSLAVTLRSPSDVLTAQTRDATINALLNVRQPAPARSSNTPAKAVAAPKQNAAVVATPLPAQQWGSTWKIKVIRGSSTSMLEVKDSTFGSN